MRSVFVQYPKNFRLRKKIESFKKRTDRTDKIVFDWFFEASKNLKITEAQQLAIILEAFEMWEKSGVCVFKRTNDLQLAEIVLKFDDEVVVKTDRKPHGIRAFQSVDSDGRKWIFIDPTEDWVIDLPERFSDQIHFRTVIAHEIGHALQLTHSQNDPTSIMHDPAPAMIEKLTAADLDSLRSRLSATQSTV